MSVKEADMKTTIEALTRCQGDAQNFGGHFTFVDPFEFEFNDYNVSTESSA